MKKIIVAAVIAIAAFGVFTLNLRLVPVNQRLLY